MNFTEEWLQDYMQRRGQGKVAPLAEHKNVPLAPKPKKSAPLGKYQGENLRLILPFKLPTWNALLAMNHWQRAKLRNWIKKQVSECILNGDVSQTQTGFQLKLSLTPSSLQEYSAMIQPNSSKKLRTAKKLAKLKKP